MSFARFGPNSDVYVYEDTNGGFTCERCPGRGQQHHCETAAEMLAHLLAHRAKGDRVPDDAIAEIQELISSGVTIRDLKPDRSGLAFDLIDILVLLGADAQRSNWTVPYVECVGGEAAAALDAASEAQEQLTGMRLIELARGLVQTIDGEFIGSLPGEAARWIVIRAVDSSAFDVETDREDVLRLLRARFLCVEEIPV
jgi:hypothetical protein